MATPKKTDAPKTAPKTDAQRIADLEKRLAQLEDKFIRNPLNNCCDWKLPTRNELAKRISEKPLETALVAVALGLIVGLIIS